MEGLVMIVLSLVVSATCLVDRIPNLDIGVPTGFLPYCPGVEKNSTLTKETLNTLQVGIHWVENGLDVYRDYPIDSVLTHILNSKEIDLRNKKTVFYAVAYYDSSFNPLNKKLASLYSEMGYNVLMTETFSILTRHYPKATRLTRVVGLKVGELLVKLVANGLDVANLELLGMSLGAHVISFAAKHLIAETGKKPYRLTGLDPAGPCFRYQPPDEIFSYKDAERVSVIHTNIDVYGMARNLGHVDFYVNGGEYQIGEPKTPLCLALCSHTKAELLYIEMLKYPTLFIGVKCDSIQDARYSKCYGNTERNLAGPLTDFSKPGIYYLPTKQEYPYYGGEEGLLPENEPFEKYMREENAEEVYVV